MNDQTCCQSEPCIDEQPSPPQFAPGLTFRFDGQELDKLRYMTENASDEELLEFLRGDGYFESSRFVNGLNNRDATTHILRAIDALAMPYIAGAVLTDVTYVVNNGIIDLSFAGSEGEIYRFLFRANQDDQEQLSIEEFFRDAGFEAHAIYNSREEGVQVYAVLGLNLHVSHRLDFEMDIMGQRIMFQYFNSNNEGRGEEMDFESFFGNMTISNMAEISVRAAERQAAE